MQINSTCGSGSIGKICKAVSQLLSENKIENYILYTLGHSDYPLGINCGNVLETRWYAFKSRIFGDYGFNASKSTKRIIRELDRISPNIVHIHNIHSHNCNFFELFQYLKERRIKVFYTFHDCWAFTGYCMYFDALNCSKWKTNCYDCPQRRKYSWFFDKSEQLYNMKKLSFAGLDSTIITPSEWLANLTKDSFLKGCQVKTINNGIDLSVFKPAESDFRQRYNIEEKFVILGVASIWEKRKGLDTFISLSKQLSDDFSIVLVGTTKKIDKFLPNNIISIHRTESQTQLAEIYSAADVLVNPTMEENFPTVNIESIACGTPVITYDTGGSAEMLNEHCGIVIKKGDYKSLLSEIKSLRCSKRFNSCACVDRASAYDQNVKFNEYLKLYIIK